MVSILESKLQFHNERMVKFLQNLALCLRACNLIGLDHELLFDRLHCVNHVGGVVVDEVDFAIAAPADYFEELKVVHGDCLF
jgi:hypothetical protein